ncbi:DUF3572 family protein [Chelativorans sp. ZYF759]|uniref:DUF3572 domain-containing protein n=1 Tax=Chelativorans sp. ZYF759 TaxID=2692213 RepID=UPI00145F907E|nr:DUF3572 domain-containing protein [Chelativorans sp. ZYF759]NMG39127.1 DUF3572 family protein [Chelativorans sp. ZYF759]
MTRNKAPTEAAESLAIAALVFIASDEKLLPRFLSITGIEASGIREAAQEPGFLAGVLDFILAHEPTLMAFCAESARDPASVAAARRRLPGGEAYFETSV